MISVSYEANHTRTQRLQKLWINWTVVEIHVIFSMIICHADTEDLQQDE